MRKSRSVAALRRHGREKTTGSLGQRSPRPIQTRSRTVLDDPGAARAALAGHSDGMRVAGKQPLHDLGGRAAVHPGQNLGEGRTLQVWERVATVAMRRARWADGARDSVTQRRSVQARIVLAQHVGELAHVGRVHARLRQPHPHMLATRRTRMRAQVRYSQLRQVRADTRGVRGYDVGPLPTAVEVERQQAVSAVRAG
ncbi:hypothetical protein [Prescottella equi]|uniref:hypothetical protein n=1 Tax=Rhodococcus hoagii TaxID=43767 RepID=UPI00384CD7B2